MKREFLVAVGGATLVIAALSGCSSEEKKAEPAAPTAEATGEAGTASVAAAPSGGTTVSIDGQDQTVTGTVVCSANAGNMNIAIGDAGTGIVAVLSEGDAPAVQSVALGTVNGVVLAYQTGVGQGEATATKDGDNYKISGTATGIDPANPMQPANKPFEIAVACP